MTKQLVWFICVTAGAAFYGLGPDHGTPAPNPAAAPLSHSQMRVKQTPTPDTALVDLLAHKSAPAGMPPRARSQEVTISLTRRQIREVLAERPGSTWVWTPVRKEGKPAEGGRVTFTDPANPMAKLGLKSGDVLLSISGNRVGELAGWSCRHCSEFWLDIRRGGQYLRLTYGD